MIYFLLLIISISVNAKNITIIAASKREDVNWLHELKHKLDNLNDNNNYDIKIYRPNEPNYIYTTEYEKGFEACMYLKYIIDYYDNLSDYNLFIHAHRSSWHSRDMLNYIPRIDWYRLTYHNINVDHFQKIELHKNDNIVNLMKLITEKVYKEIPPFVNGYCCAQFIVTKELILRHKKEIYEDLNTLLRENHLQNHQSSRSFEYLWGYIFTHIHDMEAYDNGLCSFINCTENEYKDKNINFKLLGYQVWNKKI